jgi:precorrin-6B methylase 2
MKLRQKVGVFAVCCAIGISFSHWTSSTKAATVPKTLLRPALAQTPDAAPKTEPDVPYVPTPVEVVQEMLELAAVKQGDVIYDLGSGDGRLVIEAAQKFGVGRGVGIEINPRLVRESQENAKQAGVSDRVQFRQQDLFQTDISDANVVTLYLLPRINIQLRPKLLNELKPGTRIVSHAFDMDDWKPDRTVVVDRPSRQHILYYWVIPAKVAGTWQGTLSTPNGKKQPYTLQLTQKFQQVDGVLGINGQKLNFSGAKLTGNQISFTNNRNLFGQKFNLKFNGRINGNTIDGTAVVQTGDRSASTYRLLAQRTQATSQK